MTWKCQHGMWFQAFEGDRLVADLSQDIGGIWTLRTDSRHPYPGWNTFRRYLTERGQRSLRSEQAIAWANRLIEFDKTEAKRHVA